MTFVSVSTLRGSGPTAESEAIAQALTLHCHKCSGDKRALEICVGAKLAESLRFQDGDRIDILFDQQARKAKLVRVTHNGWTLRQVSRNRLRTSVTLCPGMPSVSQRLECDGITRTPDGCVFDLPESTVFVGEEALPAVGETDAPSEQNATLGGVTDASPEPASAT
ncbi:hypothetical protein VRRI112168_14950 [Vreelandella rituensis]|uniref:Uncharacterized protein n=1 Tax=Vreelandella rituensis TaxID=2282306 RepID=A0A368U988_9GAMM|nr:hypothetical protein [Halomonas rituensis]RCV93779.1 hypothetical protein DU506_01080 [Halomonas rituensis]